MNKKLVIFLAISTQDQVAVVAMTDTGIFNSKPDGTVEMDGAFEKVAQECLR